MTDTTRETNLGEELERFVKEQASRFGDVISYVPATLSTAQSISITPEITMSDKTSKDEIIVTHHGFAELKTKLEPYRNDNWASATSLDVMQDAIQNCQRCPLGQTRNKLVFGVGDPHSKLLVIGEAPGADEDAKGEPFVGRAGQLLTKMLAAIEFDRKDIFITNILKSRPPNNRDPKPDEVEACEPYLWKQIMLINPKLILCLGRVAGTNLLKINETLGKMRGNIYDYYGVKVIVTYHPAALLRNPDWKHGAWEDLKKLRRMYEELP
jgi:uracil-DNA glycosylase family 4